MSSSSSKSYARALRSLVAEAQVGRGDRAALESDQHGRSLKRGGPGRVWINGQEVGDPNPLFAQLRRSYE